MSRTSPGIMSPADNFTISPGTRSRSGISFAWLSRTTVAVTVIIAFNLAAALSARDRIAESRIHSRAAEIIHAQTTLKDFPLDVPTRDNLGVLLIKAGDAAGAIQQWTTSLQIDPNDGNALNNLGWALATHPVDAIRDGKKAVELAEKASALPGGQSPIVLRTLAAAYAESGDFAKAIGIAQRAVESATAQGNNSLVETLRHEIELYQTQTAYREKPSE